MSLILNIDTSFEKGMLVLSDKGKPLAVSVCNDPKEQSSWLLPAIKDMVGASGYQLTDLSAVGVVSGPGSYTGLRVGMSTAKGLCYALNLPLLTETSLKLLALQVLPQISANSSFPDLGTVICPMIDARRMEVFLCMYSSTMHELMQPGAMILEESFFAEKAKEHPIIFCGNAVPKWEKVFRHSNVKFSDQYYTEEIIAKTLNEKYLHQDFTLLAYAEPVYLKEVYIHPQY